MGATRSPRTGLGRFGAILAPVVATVAPATSLTSLATAQSAPTPLVVVVEVTRPGISPALVRARVSVALDRPTISPADPAAEGVSELLLIVLAPDATWGVLTHARGDGEVETLRASGPAREGRVPPWLADAAVALVLGDDAVDRPPRRPRARPRTLGEELVRWRIPREVIDPFPREASGARPPIMSYEILDPWRRGETVDPWAPRAPARLRGPSAADGLSAPPPPRRRPSRDDTR